MCLVAVFMMYKQNRHEDLCESLSMKKNGNFLS